MIPGIIQNHLGTWEWWLRPSYLRYRGGDGMEEEEAIGPTETVDPGPMIEGPWWAEKPWFTEALSEAQAKFLYDAGYPSKLLMKAAEGLSRLLPRDVCARLAHEHETRMLIAPLYQPYPPFIRPLLALGCDLVEARPWDDEHQLQRLLFPAEHWGAATEVSVLAALRRSGLRVEREPRGRGEKKPEFLVDLDGGQYFVEVKTSRDSLIETRASQLERGLMWLHGDFAEFGIVAVRGSGVLHDLLADSVVLLREDLGSELRGELRSFLDRARASGSLPTGPHSVGPYLIVEVGTSGERGTSIGLRPEIPEEEAANRVIRQIRRAAKQIPPERRGFVVVEIGSVKNIAALQEAVETSFAADPVAFTPVRGVVFHVGTPTNTGHHLRRVFGGASPNHVLDPAEEELLRGLVLPRVEGGDLVREALYGAGPFRLLEITVEKSGS